jgi:DNA polymerase III sliding clamp (beta) subunit (PCNA family)
MEIEVAKRDLEAALQVATIAMASGQTTDLTSHYLFRVKGGEAEILTASHRTFCGTPLTCRVAGEDGAFSIEGWRLRQWLKAVGDVAVSFKHEDGVTHAATPRGKMSFASLDPDKFPFFETNLKEAVETGSVTCGRLCQVLGYVQPFILDRENTHPQMSLTEAKEGNLYATDLVAMTMIRLTDPKEDGEAPLTLGESELRVHVKDVSPVIGFLRLSTESNVKVLEHKDVCVMFQREDGSILGAARPQNGFPRFPKDVSVDTEDDIYWVVSVDELKSAIVWLCAGAKLREDKVWFRWADNTLNLSMEASSGGEVKLPIEAVEHEGLDKLPSTGFRLPHSYVTEIISHFDDETVRFGITAKTDDDGNQTGKGYVRFGHEAGGDKYMTLVAWS